MKIQMEMEFMQLVEDKKEAEQKRIQAQQKRNATGQDKSTSPENKVHQPPKKAKETKKERRLRKANAAKLAKEAKIAENAKQKLQMAQEINTISEDFNNLSLEPVDRSKATRLIVHEPISNTLSGLIQNTFWNAAFKTSIKLELPRNSRLKKQLAIALEIIDAFSLQGFNACFGGGFVRDLLLGIRP